MRRYFVPLALLVCLAGISAAQNRRETVVRDDKKQVEADTSWIYNDLDKGFAAARAEKKPLMMLIRCVP